MVDERAGEGFEQVAGPLRLRRPHWADLPAYTLLHTDPRTYAHAPESIPDALGCRIRLDEDLQHWRDHGFGYLAVEEEATGRLVGWGGVRSYPHHPSLNLYYRQSHDRLGRGYGRLLARTVTVSATEWLPERTVRASVRRTNPVSLRTALAAGLVRIGLDERPDDPPDAVSDLLELPRVVVPDLSDAVDDALHQQLLDVWTRVVLSGGAVGFLPDARCGEIEPVLDEQLADTSAGRSVLAVLVGPRSATPADPERQHTAGRVLGFGWWQRDPHPLRAHLVMLSRLQVDPQWRGRNLGRLLLAGMHAVARTMPGVDLLRLDYRSGHGVGDFYARAGWVETGRQPGGLRVAEGDERDDVSMMRRVDGGPLVGDGLT